MARLSRGSFIVSVAALALFVNLAACRRTENQGSAPSAAKPRPRPPKGAIVPFPGAPIAARVTLRIGTASGLRSPRGIAVDTSGNVYVADSGNGRVVKFDSSGRELTSFGRKGAGPGEFMQVWTPVLSPQGNILVLDRGSAWISVFTADGQFTRRFGGPDMHSYFPGGFAVSAGGSLFLADTGQDRVVKLNPDGVPHGETLKVVLGIPLKQPTDVAADSRGGLHIYQTATLDTPSLLFHLPPSGASGTMWVVVDAPSTLDSPRCVVAPNGRVYLTDPEKRQVLAYTPAGETYQVIKLEGPDAQPFQKPGSIAIDPAGRLYVVDVDANLIYRLELASSG